jgi:hypothetical protein
MCEGNECECEMKFNMSVVKVECDIGKCGSLETLETCMSRPQQQLKLMSEDFVMPECMRHLVCSSAATGTVIGILMTGFAGPIPYGC